MAAGLSVLSNFHDFDRGVAWTSAGVIQFTARLTAV